MPHDNQEELFTHVDSNDIVLGSVTRRQAHQDPTLIHRAVDVLIFNNQNEILLQKRSLHKDTNPGTWTISASGHVTHPQTYKEAAIRELQEELGLTLPLKFLFKHLVSFKTETEYAAVYQGFTNQKYIKFDPIEIDEVVWVSLNSLPDFFRQNSIYQGGILTLKAAGYL